MRFAVGYPLKPIAQLFFEQVRPFLHNIAELYFAWPGMVSGRSPMGENDGYTDYNAQERLMADLSAFRNAGVALDLLLNGNCYGEDAMAETLARSVESVLGYLEEEIGLPEVVTTASPAVAYVVKRMYPDIRIRASVNMRIGTVEGMQYLDSLFDEYVIQRDINRHLDLVAELIEWANAHGKRLTILANSGCLRNCPGQIYHDNLVAHGSRADALARIQGFTPHTCWRYYTQHPEEMHALMQATWIRPEDLHHYAPYFDVVKLATRMHPMPTMVLEAYACSHFDGNLLDLLEPGFGALLDGRRLENKRIPANWFEQALTCDKRCHHCNVCHTAWQSALT